MTTYYISPEGSDVNNGLGPDASHATNKPWLTWGKVLASGSSVVPGDVVYAAPGWYFGSALTVISGVSSNASPTTIEGDPNNRQGFKTAAGVRLAPGIVHISTRTATEGLGGDLASTANLWNLNSNGVKGLILRKLSFEADQTNGNAISTSLATNQNLIIEDCRFVSLNGVSGSAGAPTAGRGHRIRRCTVLGGVLFNISNTTAAATADADLDVILENNLLLGARLGSFAIGAAGGNIGGGVICRGNTCIAGGAQNVITTANRVSQNVPIRLSRNLLIGSANVQAGAAGEIVSDGYNVELRVFTNTNYTPHGTDIVQPAMLLNLPDLVKHGVALPVLDVFGWAPDAAAAQRHSGGTATDADWRGRTVRPWGNVGPAVGCWESPDLAMDTGGQFTGGGNNSLKLTGAGEVSLFIPVKAVETTITIKTKSTNYGGTNYPQMVIEADGPSGVTEQSDTAASASEDTLSVTFTPTAAGVVELRLISRSSTPSSATYFDVLT